MQNKAKRIVYVCVASVIVTVLAAVCSRQVGGSPRVIGEIPPAEDTVTEFFEAYRAGDFDRLDTCVYGFSSTGLSEPEEGASAILFDYARTSLSFEPGEVRYSDSTLAEETVSVRYFSIPDTMEPLHSLLEPELLEKMKQADSELNTSDEDEEYYNEVVAPAVEISAERFIETGADECFKEADVSIELIYDGKEWKLVMNDDLKKVLLAGMA